VKILDGQKGKRCDEKEYLTYTHKRCPKCGAVKVVSLFYRKNTTTARGWAWDSHCIECRRAYCVSYGISNRDRRNARLRAWRIKNPIAARKNEKRAHLRRKYGLLEGQVEAMRNAQHGKCAICERTTSRLFVDHCHTKGHVRSLLCQTCNTFLGWYERKADAILRFQRYVAHHAKP
jgi:formate dehydrogenase maturation protein FdhE